MLESRQSHWLVDNKACNWQSNFIFITGGVNKRAIENSSVQVLDLRVQNILSDKSTIHDLVKSVVADKRQRFHCRGDSFVLSQASYELHHSRFRGAKSLVCVPRKTEQRCTLLEKNLNSSSSRWRFIKSYLLDNRPTPASSRWPLACLIAANNYSNSSITLPCASTGRGRSNWS